MLINCIYLRQEMVNCPLNLWANNTVQSIHCGDFLPACVGNWSKLRGWNLVCVEWNLSRPTRYFSFEFSICEFPFMDEFETFKCDSSILLQAWDFFIWNSHIFRYTLIWFVTRSIVFEKFSGIIDSLRLRMDFFYIFILNSIVVTKWNENRNRLTVTSEQNNFYNKHIGGNL